jgi:hypothetical protein
VIIDISEQVLERFQYQDLAEKNTVTLSIKKQMISWLEQNVGEYHREVEQEHGRAYIGSGWEWGTRSETVYTHPSGTGFQTTWFVKIDDEAAATMFRLKFL